MSVGGSVANGRINKDPGSNMSRQLMVVMHSSSAGEGMLILRVYMEWFDWQLLAVARKAPPEIAKLLVVSPTQSLPGHPD